MMKGLWKLHRWDDRHGDVFFQDPRGAVVPSKAQCDGRYARVKNVIPILSQLGSNKPQVEPGWTVEIPKTWYKIPGKDKDGKINVLRMNPPKDGPLRPIDFHFFRKPASNSLKVQMESQLCQRKLDKVTATDTPDPVRASR